MRAFLPRRVLITLISGALTLAVVAAVMVALNLRAPQRGAHATTATPRTSVTYTVYSTPTSSAPTASAATPTNTNTPGTSTTANTTTSGGGATGTTPTTGRVPSGPPSATPTTAPTATPTSTTVGTPPSTGTATPTPIPPTPTSTPANPVDDATVTGSYTVNKSYTVGIAPTVVMSNTGTTTWISDWSYYLGCVSNCLGGSPLSTTAQIAPGQSKTFTLQLFVTVPFTTSTYYSKWSMFHSGTPFGALATIKIVATAAIPLGVDPAPGCDSSTMTWSLAGGATCANGGLSLTANSAQEPTLSLQSGPSGFDNANYYITVQATFSSMSQTWVRVMGGSQCNAQGVDVQPDGGYRSFFIANCKETDYAWSLWPTAYSNTFTVTLALSSGSDAIYVNKRLVENGGSIFTSGNPVVSVGGKDGNVVTVTNAELDTPVNPIYWQWNVVQ